MYFLCLQRKVQTGTYTTGTGNSTKKQGKPNGLESISEKKSNVSIFIFIAPGKAFFPAEKY